jgi:hypothetical protein
MNIHLIFQNSQGDEPSPLKPITLGTGQIQLVPQIGDEITDGNHTRTVKAREFQYKENDLTIRLSH